MISVIVLLSVFCILASGNNIHNASPSSYSKLSNTLCKCENKPPLFVLTLESRAPDTIDVILLSSSSLVCKIFFNCLVEGPGQSNTANPLLSPPTILVLV